MPRTEQHALAKSWWAAVWRGLVVDESAKHYRRMDGALWLFVYLVVHADRKEGVLRRKYATVARDMGLKERTVRGWMTTLRRHGYVSVRSNGRGLVIHITKWKTFTPSARVTTGARPE
jgi:hypothetical protein